MDSPRLRLPGKEFTPYRVSILRACTKTVQLKFYLQMAVSSYLQLKTKLAIYMVVCTGKESAPNPARNWSTVATRRRSIGRWFHVRMVLGKNEYL